MSIPLSQLKPGHSGRVATIASRGPMRQRLFDLGLIPERPSNG